MSLDVLGSFFAIVVSALGVGEGEVFFVLSSVQGEFADWMFIVVLDLGDWGGAGFALEASG